jgi:perosamine synthetase
VIHLAEPVFYGNEEAYVRDALQHRQLSAGAYVARFETAFAALAGCTFGIATSSGTTALHLMLVALGLGPGDEVILPDLTFVATANAVTYTGATPVLADVLPDTWCIDPWDVERRISARTRAVLAVHLYGQPADMTALRALCAGYELPLLEDAAEAPGAYWAGRPVGCLGELAAFSFYGNKIITTGEGGMVTTNDAELAARLRLFRGQGQEPERRYWHPVIGYNYRMTELQGALGLAQTEDFAAHLQARRRVAEMYRTFAPQLRWQGEAQYAEPAYWLNVALFEERAVVADALGVAGIETRPVFYPLHHLPPYADLAPAHAYPVAREVSERGLCLPSHAQLAASDVGRICEIVQEVLA